MIYGNTTQEIYCEDRCDLCINYDKGITEKPCVVCDLVTRNNKTVLSKFKKRDK